MNLVSISLDMHPYKKEESMSFPLVEHVVPSKKENIGTSLLVQRLGICLPMQGMRVQSLVGELRSHMLSSN